MYKIFGDLWDKIQGAGDLIIGIGAERLSKALGTVAQERTKIGAESTVESLKKLQNQYPEIGQSLGLQAIRNNMWIIAGAIVVAAWFLSRRGGG